MLHLKHKHYILFVAFILVSTFVTIIIDAIMTHTPIDSKFTEKIPYLLAIVASVSVSNGKKED